MGDRRTSASSAQQRPVASSLFSRWSLLAALVAMPWWGDAGEMRLVAEMAYYVALAQLWNLLAGYAGLRVGRPAGLCRPRRYMPVLFNRRLEHECVCRAACSPGLSRG